MVISECLFVRGDENCVVCTCGQPAMLLTVKKDGPNQGELMSLLFSCVKKKKLRPKDMGQSEMINISILTFCAQVGHSTNVQTETMAVVSFYGLMMILVVRLQPLDKPLL